jgi:hypothetical protein
MWHAVRRDEFTKDASIGRIGRNEAARWSFGVADCNNVARLRG